MTPALKVAASGEDAWFKPANSEWKKRTERERCRPLTVMVKQHTVCTVWIAAEKSDVDKIAVLPLAVLLTKQVTWCIMPLGALSKTNRSNIMDLHHGLGLLKSLTAYKPLSISTILQRSFCISQCNFIILFSVKPLPATIYGQVSRSVCCELNTKIAV